VRARSESCIGFGRIGITGVYAGYANHVNVGSLMERGIRYVLLSFLSSRASALDEASVPTSRAAGSCSSRRPCNPFSLSAELTLVSLQSHRQRPGPDAQVRRPLSSLTFVISSS